jgi:PAS domain S-box-containing protein
MKCVGEPGGRDQEAKGHFDRDALRKRAEGLLEDNHSSQNQWNQAEGLRLIQELEVHQAELEIQGEELRRKNKELEELFHRYAALYQNAPVGFLTLDTNWLIVEANNIASEALGLPKSKIKHRTFSPFIFPEDYSKYYKLLIELNRTRDVKADAELRLVKYSGPPFFAHVEIVPFRTGGGPLQGWLIAFIDITRRKAAEEALTQAANRLRSMSARILSIQEEERKSIARDLHDSFGQTLAAVKFAVESTLAGSAASLPGQTVDLLQKLVPLLQGAIEEVRNLYTGLRPSTLDDMGIIATLHWLIRKTGEVFPDLHIERAFEIEEKDVPEELKIILFRIVQEALTNVTKHSEAQRVKISLVALDSGIELIVEDNGIGFDLEAFERKDDRDCLGLLGMRERTELSGGDPERLV